MSQGISNRMGIMDQYDALGRHYRRVSKEIGRRATGRIRLRLGLSRWY